MPVPLTDLTRQHQALMPQLREAFIEVAASGQLILGPYVRKFEEQIAEYCGVKHAIGVSSGNDAIMLALLALGIGEGDEVITTPLAYLHIAESIARVGATPVFADIDPRTYNLDVDQLPGRITAKTKAILPTHLFGLPANMGPIMALAAEHHIKVIEDTDMAIGAKFDGQPVGSIGDVATMSFYPTKNLAALGDAGACLTNDDDLAARLKSLRVHGIEPGFVVPELGGAFRLDGLQAAMLSVKLPHLETWTAKRRELAKRYHKLLEPLALTTPFEAEEREHVFNQYVIRVRGEGREPLRMHLDAMDIGNRVYYPKPVHRLACFSALNYGPGSLPIAEKASQELLALPMFPEMTRDEQDEVVGAVRDFFAGD
ncbi:MAG: DegT/DnrJ/EryC1/StrS family aminotransferase [Planctomycetota bacterium]